jgi:hypothetical protein
MSDPETNPSPTREEAAKQLQTTLCQAEQELRIATGTLADAVSQLAAFPGAGAMPAHLQSSVSKILHDATLARSAVMSLVEYVKYTVPGAGHGTTNFGLVEGAVPA